MFGISDEHRRRRRGSKKGCRPPNICFPAKIISNMTKMFSKL